jgi:hypothetical protein
LLFGVGQPGLRAVQLCSRAGQIVAGFGWVKLRDDLTGFHAVTEADKARDDFAADPE